jgi:hypothetical protein
MCAEVGFPEAATLSQHDHAYLPAMHLFPQAECNAYVQITPKLCDSWNRLGKLVSREGAIIGPRVVVRSA